MMAYHEALWVVAGTGCPVVALANTVTVREASRVTTKIKIVRRHEKHFYPISMFFARLALWSSILSLIICTWLMFTSLDALYTESDGDMPDSGVAASLLGVCVFFLLFQVAADAWINNTTPIPIDGMLHMIRDDERKAASAKAQDTT